MKNNSFVSRLLKYVGVMVVALVFVAISSGVDIKAATMSGTSGRWRYEVNDVTNTASVRALGDIGRTQPTVQIPSTITHLGKRYPVTAIMDGGLSSCSSATAIIIPETVTDIGAYAFQGCYNLKSITIPASVTYIGEFAFDECTALNFINVAAQNALFSSQQGAMYNASMSSLLCVPAGYEGEFVVPDSVDTIASGAFAYCSNITSIQMSRSVTSIGASAFRNCTGLQNITIPGSVTYMGEAIFESCSSLTTVRFEEGITFIESYTFQNCTSLQTVYIPSTCGGFGYSIFESCTIVTKSTIIFGGTPEQWQEVVQNSDRGNEEFIGCCVSFESNCGVEIEPQNVDKGSTATRPEDPDNGYYNDLIGWYEDPEFIDEWDFSTPVRESMTLYANWKNWNLVVDNGVIVDAEEINQGGNPIEIRADKVKGNFEYNDYITVRPNPAPEGMKFAFWSRDGGETPLTYTEEYSFYFGIKQVLTPVYVSESEEVDDNMIITPCLISVDKTSKVIRFGNEAYVPSELTFVKMGIIATDDTNLGTNAENFILGDSNVMTALEECSDPNGRFENEGVTAGVDFVRFGATYEANNYQFNWGKGNVQSTWYVRGYVLYRDTNNNLCISYSDINAADLNTVDDNSK